MFTFSQIQSLPLPVQAVIEGHKSIVEQSKAILKVAEGLNECLCYSKKLCKIHTGKCGWSGRRKSSVAAKNLRAKGDGNQHYLNFDKSKVNFEFLVMQAETWIPQIIFLPEHKNYVCLQMLSGGTLQRGDFKTYG
jgi:hypothetical protein